MNLLLQFFSHVFIVSFKQISHLDLQLSVISFALSPEEATRAVLKKGGVLQKYSIFTGKRLC